MGDGHDAASPRQLDTVGILGAGQLAMMLSGAAADIGVRTEVYAPAQALGRPVGDRLATGELTDVAALAAFCDGVDVLTFETENIDLDAVEAVADRVVVRPSIETVRIAQDRLREKRFAASAGAATAAFAPIDTADDVDAAVAEVGVPAIIKTRRMGYDGKGQARITDPTEAADAWRSLGEVPCIVEAMVPFDCEISVVAARSADGAFVPFTPGRNDHLDGVLRRTTAPAELDGGVIDAALAAARRMLDALDYVGVAGIEFFVVGDEVLVNEMAPRVHNSGHWTQLGCAVDQFSQHIRAITDRPLGDGAHHGTVEMTNLLGDDAAEDAVAELLADPAAAVVLYGKPDIRPGRKMGHVNRLLGAD
ncbi:MAG: 5-(carboxyamino)imidazole ribonucleotide synthase [Actinomycetota bacterium]